MGYRQIQLNEATATQRYALFHLVDATDGITVEDGEAAGQPEISTNGGAFTSTGIGTLNFISDGRYYAAITQAALNGTVGDVIDARYKSANTAEAWMIGGPVQVVTFDPLNTIADVETDTQDIQGRLPAALVGGAMDSDVSAMQAGTVTASALATAAIDADAIAADAITAAKIADAAIDAATFAAGAIDAAAIATDAITAAKIASDAITAAKIATGAIAADAFAAGAIDAAAIATDAIDADALATDAIAEITAATDVVLTAAHGSGSWASVSGLTGARTITISLEDQDTNPAVGLTVDVYDATNVTFQGRLIDSDLDGVVTLLRNDGTYSLRILGNRWTPDNAAETLVVTADAAVTYSGTLVAVGTAADPALCTVQGYILDIGGNAIDGLTLTFEGAVPTSANDDQIDDTDNSVVTGAGAWADGYFEIDLMRGAKARVLANGTVGVDGKIITIPDAASADFTTLITAATS